MVEGGSHFRAAQRVTDQRLCEVSPTASAPLVISWSERFEVNLNSCYLEGMRSRPSGFSFPELVFGLVLLSILLLASIQNFGSSRGRASSEGMAMVIAAELEAARGKAITSRLPVAFCLPTSDGSRPYSQFYYLMEGQVEPKPTSNRNFSGDFPASYMAMVYWGSAVTTSRPVKAGSAPENAVSAWLGDRVKRDYAIVFMPDGSVMSNDLPLVGGEYRLVVASGLKVLAGNPPGHRQMPSSARPQYYELKEAFAAHTISLSPQGEIRVSAGIENPSGVKIGTASIGFDSAPAQPPRPPVPPSTLPTIRSVAVYPKPFLEPKATVQQERNLSLIVEARDSDGQQLYCTWESQPLGPLEKGFFSLEDQHPMVWDKKRRNWVSKCTWAPPPTANVGDQYVLTCRVVDSDGNEVDMTADVLNPVTVIPPGKILFDRAKKTTYNREIAIINSDGTGLRYLTDSPADNSGPSISPDGSKIAWCNKSAGTKGEIFTMNSDGTGKRRVTNHNSNKFNTHFSPDGTKLIYARNWPDRLYSANLDGSGEALLDTIQGSSSYSVCFSPDGRYIINVANIGGGGFGVSGEVIVSEWVSNGSAPPSLLDTTNVTNDSALGVADRLPVFIPGGSNYELIWATVSVGPSGTYSDRINAVNFGRLQDNGAGTVPRFEIVDRQVIRADDISDFVFSPDASKVIFIKQYPTYGLWVGDWDDSSPTPKISGDRRLTGFYQAEYPRAWTR